MRRNIEVDNLSLLMPLGGQGMVAVTRESPKGTNKNIPQVARPRHPGARSVKKTPP